MALDFASIGLRIKHARTKKEMTQDQLAELLKISRPQVSYMETGERGISLELLVSISNHLQVPISELLADNLTSDSTSDDDLHYILLNCTKQEERIITKTAQALKEILYENGI